MAAAATTATTLTECIPTIISTALLELQEGNIMQPLVTDIDFPGPGLVSQTPKIAKLTAETDDSLEYQSMDSGGYTSEASPSAATCAVHGAYISLKDIAALGSVGDMAVLAGQLIGNCLVVRKDLDLVTLFTTLSTNQGALTGTPQIAPADLYDAYGALRTYFAKPPYYLVLAPLQIWASKGLISLFDNSSDAIQSEGLGTVGEDFARYGFSGMALGFNLFADANIALDGSYNGSGAAFSKEAFKNVTKRSFQIEIERDAIEVADKIVGSEIRGEAILRNLHGNRMQFSYA